MGQRFILKSGSFVVTFTQSSRRDNAVDRDFMGITDLTIDLCGLAKIRHPTATIKNAVIFHTDKDAFNG
jgi:hypothetical protein